MAYKVFKTKEEARAKLSPGGALFAVDICGGGPKGFIAAASASGFADWFLRRPDSKQMHYEIIPDGVPIKLYFDVEYLHAENPGLSIDAVVAQINASTQKVLGMPDLLPFQTDASNAKKASRHLAYPVVLPSKVHVRCVVQHVLADLRRSGTAPATSAKGQVCGIDEGVYDKERNFRLCYSHKWGQPERKLLPVEKVASKLETLQRATISHFLDGLQRVEWQLDDLNQRYATKEEARRHLKPGGALFAVEVCQGGAKNFVAVDSPESFVPRYLELPDSEQMYHEIIRDGAPIKLYFDVEFLRADNAGLAMDAVVARIIASVQKVLGMPDLLPFQTDASNGVKASRHLTFPVLLPSKIHVKSVVQRVLDDLRGTAPVTNAKTGQVCGIDEGVYDRERNFRICYSHKWGQQERKLVPVGDVASKLEAMQKSMISYFIDGLPRVEWKLSTTTGVKRAGHETTPDLLKGDDLKLGKIWDFVHQNWPGSCKAGPEKRYKNMLQVSLRPGVLCPNAGRVHKSNCTFFNVEWPDGVGHLYCPDPDCQKRWGRFRVEL